MMAHDSDDERAPFLHAADSALSPEEKRLTTRTILLYAAPSFALTVLYGSPYHVFAVKFYVDTLGVRPISISLATAVARAVDAVTTPTVAWAVERGVIGKRLCGSLGRRARTIVLATLLACTAMYWLFNPRSDNPLALSFGVLSSLFLVFSAMLGQAYTALGMELATRYDERTVLTGVESLFAFAGDILYLALPNFLASAYSTVTPAAASRRVMHEWCIYALAPALLLLFCFVPLRDPDRSAAASPPDRRPPMAAALHRALRNPIFAMYVPVKICLYVVGQLMASVFPFYVEHVVQAPLAEVGTWTGAGFVALYAAALPGVLLGVVLSRRLGKKGCLLLCWTLGCANMLTALATATPGGTLRMLVLLGINGLLGGAWAAADKAIGGDIVDHDALYSGEPQQALFQGLWTFFPKLASIVFQPTISAALALAGYVPGAHPQPPAVRHAINALFIVLPVAVSLFGIAVMLRFPIDRRAHERIVRALAAHSMGEAAVDPLTGRSVPPPLRGSAGGDDYVDDARAWGLLDSLRASELRALAAAAVVGRGAAFAAALSRRLYCSAAGCGAALAAVGWWEARLLRRAFAAEEESALPVVGVCAAAMLVLCAGYQCLRANAAAALAADPRAVAAAPAHVARSAWLS